jgi:hypothetical protein
MHLVRYKIRTAAENLDEQLARITAELPVLLKLRKREHFGQMQ